MFLTIISKLTNIILAKYFSSKANKDTLYELCQKILTTMEVENDSYNNKTWNKEDGWLSCL